MADTKLSDLTELAATPAIGDEVYIRDVSEVAADESKRITIANLVDARLGALGASAWVVASDAPASILAYAAILQAASYPVWVCNGTADDVEIQAAITASGLGIVRLTQGTYNTTTELTFPTFAWTGFGKGVTLRGEGIGTVINYTPATGYAIKLQGTGGALQCSHHILDNFVVTAPNTTDSVVALLGGATFLKFTNIRIIDSPTAQAIYLENHVTYGNNFVTFENLTVRNCLYGIYATAGPSIFLAGRNYLMTTATTGKEAIYYTVTGTAGGFNQLNTQNTEINTPAEQRALYIKGNTSTQTQHSGLYTDAQRLIYLDSGRHSFQASYVGEIDWSDGTIVEIDRASTYAKLLAKDAMYIPSELRVPFLIHANSPFATTDGTIVVDATAANGYTAELDAQNEQLSLRFIWAATARTNKYIGRGKYLLKIHAKDTNQVATDLKVYAYARNTADTTWNQINLQYYTLTPGYTTIPYTFTIGEDDLGGDISIYLFKNHATANVISVDYLSVEHIGTDVHQTLGGGHQLLYLSDAGSLPTASANYRGIMACVQGVGGVTDELAMCVKTSADTYVWANILERQFTDLFMDVLAVDAAHVRSNEDLSEAIPNTFTLTAQPDVPRTLSGHFDAHAQITAYTIVITGVDAKGNIVTETFTEAASPWDFETVNAYATITSIIMTARTGTGAGDTMDIGITDVLGLSNIIYATGDVYKIKKNNANAVVAAAQVNVTYDTYDMAVIGLAATDDFTIWFRSNPNIIN